MIPNRNNSEIGDPDWLYNWARLSPENTAIKDSESDKKFSYGELYLLSCYIATHLKNDYHVTAGDRVAVLATNEIETVALFFACMRLGAILVPVNFRLTAREITHIMSDSSPRVIFVQKNLSLTLEKSGTKTEHLVLFEDFADWVSDKLTQFQLLPVKDRNTSSGNGRTWELTYHSHAESTVMILYTSGTTGAPKGACITPKMLFWNSLNTTMRLNLSQSDVFVSFLPFFHTGGWNVLLTPFIHRGARIVLTKKFDPDRILQLCESEKATILFGVPTTMEMMAKSPLFQRVDITKIRYAIVGGEPMPIELIKTWQEKGIPIRQGFGLTEFGPNVFSLSEEDAIRKIGSIGFPNFYVQTRIVDNNGNDCNPGEIGELLLTGPVCSPGYWKNEKATKDSIVDGWFHTGDLVRVDNDGYFYVAGRKKDMFISGGENVYPVEVERVLSELPKIREVAVIGVPHPKWGEIGCACVSLEPGTALTLEELTKYCADKLAKFKIPKEIRVLENLPKGDSGKILKRELRASLNL